MMVPVFPFGISGNLIVHILPPLLHLRFQLTCTTGDMWLFSGCFSCGFQSIDELQAELDAMPPPPPARDVSVAIKEYVRTVFY